MSFWVQCAFQVYRDYFSVATVKQTLSDPVAGYHVPQFRITVNTGHKIQSLFDHVFLALSHPEVEVWAKKFPRPAPRRKNPSRPAGPRPSPPRASRKQKHLKILIPRSAPE